MRYRRNINWGLVTALTVLSSCSAKSNSVRTLSNTNSSTASADNGADSTNSGSTQPVSVTGRNLVDLSIDRQCAAANCLDVTLRARLHYSDKSIEIVTSQNASKVAVSKVTFKLGANSNGKIQPSDPFALRLVSTDGQAVKASGDMSVTFADGTTRATSIQNTGSDVVGTKRLFMFISDFQVAGDLASPAQLGPAEADIVCANAAVTEIVPYLPNVRWFAGLESATQSMGQRQDQFGLGNVFAFNGQNEGVSGNAIYSNRPVFSMVRNTDNQLVPFQIAPAGSLLNDRVILHIEDKLLDTRGVKVSDETIQFWWLNGCNSWMTGSTWETGQAMTLWRRPNNAPPDISFNQDTCDVPHPVICFAAEL